ncbi:MAG TPA: CehA/McbA family metallohydrolase [Firmicutes bacterium]|jgi:hypothetical protein|nr:CehA/McbA family metallohydrolase [Bacillota bacterium]
MDRYEYIGHLHIHSNYSDGSGSIREIVQAGRETGLDFIGITDHNTLGARRDGYEGWQDGILVLIGQELGYKKNHYIAFGTDREISVEDENPQQTINAVNAQGGFGYLAHPGEKSNPAFLEGTYYPWDRWDYKGFCGLEIWNFSSLWKETFHSRLAVLFWYCFDRYRAAAVPGAEVIEKWDQLAAERPVVAFGGTDAHAYLVNLGIIKLSFFAYKFLFRTINTHLLLDRELSRQSAVALEQVLGALRRGAFFIGSDYFFPSKGFRFAAFRDGKKVAGMGGEIDCSPPVVLCVSSPPGCRGLVRIIADGQPVLESRERDIAFEACRPGVYRAEVYWRPLQGRPIPWIYSNPIYIKD